uniref:Signal transducing adaptor family member 1 n=1 Tax=Athene cunicularia TaxID=194338 RepID=A0A663MTA0_ATHCN
MLRGIREQPEETPKPAPRQIFQERQRITGLPLYLQGYLSVRHSRCQEFTAYWTELRGTTLFFYDDKKAPTYSQKLDISALMSATSVYPDENNSAQFILMLHDAHTKTIAHNVCSLFHFFNYAVHFQLSVPPHESLLPGQLRRMHEVLEKEKKRIMCNNCPSTSLSRKTQHCEEVLAWCFYAVSRQEAIEMLEKNPSCGNLILRPGSDSKNYAITIRHKLDAPCLKHYKVMSTGTSYIIKLEKQVTLPSLQDVVSYFVTQTQGNLKPFVIETRDTSPLLSL